MFLLTLACSCSYFFFIPSISVIIICHAGKRRTPTLNMTFFLMMEKPCKHIYILFIHTRLHYGKKSKYTYEHALFSNVHISFQNTSNLAAKVSCLLIES